MNAEPLAIALARYHDRFDAARYNAIADLLASNLYTEREDARVVVGMNSLQDACLELCGHPHFALAWHRLASFCGQNLLSRHTVDAMLAYLRRFSDDDRRLDDFTCTAHALLRLYSGQDDLKTATAHANGVHGWQGRMAYELLAAADYLVQAAAQLLLHGDDGYIREKLHSGLNRITGALYEGVRHSSAPKLYNFKTTYFPDERDR